MTHVARQFVCAADRAEASPEGGQRRYSVSVFDELHTQFTFLRENGPEHFKQALVRLVARGGCENSLCFVERFWPH